MDDQRSTGHDVNNASQKLTSNYMPSMDPFLIIFTFLFIGVSWTVLNMGAELWEPLFQIVLEEAGAQKSLLLASFLVGGVSSILALITYISMTLITQIRKRMYTVVEIRQNQELYYWLLDWLSEQREVHENGTRVLARLQTGAKKTNQTKMDVRFLPIDDGSLYSFFFSGCLVWLSHHNQSVTSERKGGLHFSTERRLRITMLGTSKDAAKTLFRAAFLHNKKRLQGRTEVFVAQTVALHPEQSYWRRLEPRRNRPLNTVVSCSKPTPPELLADMRDFLSREDWYADRGVPFRRGYLLHGPPGCGKTSFVTAAAGELDCPIYILNLAEPSLSDLGLLKLVTEASPRSILLMEDIDAAFQNRTRLDTASPGLLTFSGLLNALDGVAGQEGKLLVMSTNHPKRLDEALLRPGRVDVTASFHMAHGAAIRQIFTNFFQTRRNDNSGTSSSRSKDGLSKEQLLSAAAIFAAKCPEGKLTVAMIQGHLMRFRDDPLAAAVAPLTLSEDNDAKTSSESVCSAKNSLVLPSRQFAIPRGFIAQGEEE